MNRAEPLVLGIETCCDETGIGIVRGTTLLANAIASSMDEHARYGGVVPEVAARAHLEALGPTIRAALAEAAVSLDDLDADRRHERARARRRAHGRRRRREGARALARRADLRGQPPRRPRRRRPARHRRRRSRPRRSRCSSPAGTPRCCSCATSSTTSNCSARPIDDAAGEAFDKVARLLGLPYPGGPEIDRAAIGGDPKAIRFPRGLTQPKDQAAHRYDFSFSGLKTAVARWVEQREAAGEPVPLADVAASFREAVVDVLVTKAIAACTDLGVPRLLLGGGVIANARLREVAEERSGCRGHRPAHTAAVALHRQRRDDRGARRRSSSWRGIRRRASGSAPTPRFP